MKKNLLIIAALTLGFFVPKFVFAAGIYLNAAPKTASQGSIVTVEVRINTDNQYVNAVEANITYPADRFDFVKASAGSVFNIVSPGKPNGGAGVVSFSAGVPTPGYKGSAGLIGTFTVRAISQGSADFKILSAKALLNDGLGTNALSGTAGAKVSVIAAAVEAPQVSSASHPESEQWYQNNNIELSWTRPQGAYGFSFALDQAADTVPDDVLDTTVTTTQSYPEKADGVWYFHIKARQQSTGSFFSETRHYKIQIDKTAPQPFTLKLKGQNNIQDVTRTPTVDFATIDATSGIEQSEIYLDETLVDKTRASQYTFSKTAPGPHTIRAVVFDKAGNSAKSELAIIIAAPQGPAALQQSPLSRPLQIPLYFLLVMNAIILLLIILVLLLLFRRPKYQLIYQPVNDIAKEFDSDLDKLREHIDSELNKALTPSPSAFNEQEKRVVGEIAKNLEVAKKNINQKLLDLSVQPRDKK